MDVRDIETFLQEYGLPSYGDDQGGAIFKDIGFEDANRISAQELINSLK
ncbi:hypothetical protein FACS1894187_19220 [Synergistales bacterium]|nr:hypothetical protein FACS1894187_19220 [Synergistales bacterium]